MKRMKSGFTLAEVLITLGIIGVIAAIVMPSVMTNYTYKTVGVKLAKFMSQLEGAARPYVVQNEVFTDGASAASFITESFLIKNLDEVRYETITCDGDSPDSRCVEGGGEEQKIAADIVAADRPTSLESNSAEFTDNDNDIIIKDGTSFIAYALPTDYEEGDDINVDQVGEVVWGISFAPNVKGLPKAVNKSYGFVVTELGYVYPDRQNDDCLSRIYDAEFLTNSKTFDKTSSASCIGGQQAPASGS